MSTSFFDKTTESELHYVLNHVFLPPKLPQSDDNADPDTDYDVALCGLLLSASSDFLEHIPQSQKEHWGRIIEMLSGLFDSVQLFDKFAIMEQSLALEEGDVMALHIKAQNAALLMRRRSNTMIFEVFEVSPPPAAVMNTEGKLICSYPGPAVELPVSVAQDPSFVEQLVSFLAHMNVDVLDAEATTTKAGSKVPETRGTTHPRYISQLLVMILYGTGVEANVKRIAKRIADDVCYENGKNPWRRSSLWLVLRVALQTSVESRELYKSFMIYFQARLLRAFLHRDFSSDLLHAARAKTSRRVYKLADAAPSFVLEEVESVSRDIEQLMQARWTEAQRLQSASASFTPDPSTFEDDTIITLQNSRSYLTKALQPDPHTHTITTFQPSHPPCLRDIRDFGKFCPTRLKEAVERDPYVALADFEFVVQNHLTLWATENQWAQSAYTTLGSCLDQYISCSRSRYSSNPEDESIMLLTILELWVALDTVATAQCPLLARYSPEISSDILNPLLLRRSKTIERAAHVERYLRSRHAGATIKTSVFASPAQYNSFAVRYYAQTSSLQHLQASIEQTARANRSAKRVELEQKNRRHQWLTAEIDRRSCEYFTTYWGGTRHASGCYRCELRYEAEHITIDVHEWPLPENHLLAQATVFELQCPPVFSVWRSKTYEILRDFSMAHVDSSSRSQGEHHLLEDYEGLSQWSKRGTSGRICFASTTKSFLHSHYHTTAIPTSDSSVCVNHGLRYELYDSVKGEYVTLPFTPNLGPYCTLRVDRGPDRLYQHLQYTLSHTTHSHNETIVNQEDCPKNLSLHEHLAFSNLRCGALLQWKNIARELRTNVLTFGREEVHMLLAQAAWQVGPLSKDGTSRPWHFELTLSDFGAVLIRECGELLTRVEANWLECTTVKSTIYLISRLLVSTDPSHRQLCQDAYTFLRQARRVTHRWMREIIDKLQSAEDDEEANELQRRTCEIAATCRATFDVDSPPHLDYLLDSSSDIAVLVECSIVVYDNTPPDLRHAPSHIQTLLYRDRRLSHYLEERLLGQIDASGGGLDAAITSVWPGYRPGRGGWQRLANSESRWLTSFTASSSQASQRSQQVHYNVLEGKLLVDGKPLGRLPREITSHSTYKRVLGQKILDVIPADMPTMDYATRGKVHNYQIFFALRGSPPNLVIRAQSQLGQILELIPHTVLMGDFPTFLVTEHVHWMNVGNDSETGKTEFRPLTQLWDTSPHNWRLRFSILGSTTMRKENTLRLVDVCSVTFRGISARIEPLEYSEYLTAVYDFRSRTVSVELPRFRLSFIIIDSGDLESQNLPGMIIDNDQCSGTMIGLRNQLVLRHKDLHFSRLPRSRFTLIPYGEVRYSLSSESGRNHVHVDINTRNKRLVTWFNFKIDTDLGILVGGVDITSRLYRVYLHALCSHPLPDPLLCQTGTDYALGELAAAGSFSFQKLTKLEVDLLRLIGRITPRRYFYPKGLRLMQTAQWSSNLPSLSQHGAFYTAAYNIVSYAKSLSIFEDPNHEQLDFNLEFDGSSFLVDRATHRASIYYEYCTSVSPSPDHDSQYHSRDHPHDSDHDVDGVEALKSAQLIYSSPSGITQAVGPDELMNTFLRWINITGPDTDFSMAYTRGWLSLNLASKWLTIYSVCRRKEHSRSADRFELVFTFAAVAYTVPDLRCFIPILLAFSTIHQVHLPPPPPHAFYNLSDGFAPVRNQIQTIVTSHTRSLRESPAADLSRRVDEDLQNFTSRQSAYYDQHSKQRTKTVVEHFLSHQRFHSPPSPFLTDDSRWFNITEITTAISQYFTSCIHNTELRTFTAALTRTLQSSFSPAARHSLPRLVCPPNFVLDTLRLGTFSSSSFSLQNLLSDRSDSTLDYHRRAFGAGVPRRERSSGDPVDTQVLTDLISQFNRNSASSLTRIYGERLENSRKQLEDERTVIAPKEIPSLSECCLYRDQCLTRMEDMRKLLIDTVLCPVNSRERIAELGGLWPRLHRRSFLQALASTSRFVMSSKWTCAFITLAKLFIEYQHSQRLVDYALRSQADNFFKELDSACFDWEEADSYPDWLLIQIQGDFLTRAIQTKVAKEMIAPSSGESSVYQLNMGEGKSSVIVPIVVAALADSNKLVRVVILKPLAGSMFHLLVERLSGLSNRRIYYFPFSRGVTMNMSQLTLIRGLFKECAHARGVLVTQPEHILSFKLMVIDRTLASSSPLEDVARHLQETQMWLKSHSRDILDESDELLHVRYQLIYTMEQQQPLDDSPDRWTTTQQVLDLVRRHALKLHEQLPTEVEVTDLHNDAVLEGQFTPIRLLGTSASERLVSRIAESVLDGVVDNINFVGVNFDQSLRDKLLSFMTEHSVDHTTYLSIRKRYHKSALWKGLLLLRGLLAHGILAYVLGQRRWRVDYGLDLKRSLLAVPYRAKDVPSLRSEFGHPDVAVSLTALSYYYGGLSARQVRDCFEILLKLDNPRLEYGKWVKRGGADVPIPLRELMGVNMKDLQTFAHDVVPVFKVNQYTIDFYLSQVVFPKDAKEFPSKLGTSGWDLAERKDNFTTGFSGTNDNADLLPTSIYQSDPVNQGRTNARVLRYLLQPENDEYMCLQGKDGQPCSATEFIDLLVRHEKEVRVLIDVGAQMLEMTNRQLIECWLGTRPDLDAGVFFDGLGILSVFTRDGMVEPFHSSPFSQRLDRCIIYLDDEHTRGTDLKLPSDFRAVVTLGPKVTKDRLVQGCMRMRKLGYGQSLMFCAPPEVDRRIRTSQKVNLESQVQVIDVLSWVMGETCADIEHHIPHWIEQGLDYNKRKTADEAFSSVDDIVIESLRRVWLQPAARSLSEMYGYQYGTTSLVRSARTIPAMHNRLRSLGVTTTREARMEEEQEREVNHEVEQELQLERPPRIPAARHRLDDEVGHFVRSGFISTNTNTFLPLMSPLRSELQALSPPNPWSRHLLATRDFATTTSGAIEMSRLTDYLRPVNWILSNTESSAMERRFVVLSPFEANELLPEIRASRYVRLHMYAPQTIQTTKAFDDLTFYCIPPLAPAGPDFVLPSIDIRCQLNLWAGQLYLDQYETYRRMCLLLGVSSSDGVGSAVTEGDRFVRAENRSGEIAQACLFDESPLPLLKRLFVLRRKGMNYAPTHMGKIFHARLLSREDFEE